ncbi:hypothetical protein F5Y19DRAFT_486494 [Xylariaceae sp. FL1651]|nr:hypothetical protein F5Y19DRAFT_486494 [Xylariaceae sp. FL1651]
MDIIKWIGSDKTIKKKAVKTVAKYANTVSPIVQTIQAGYGAYGIGEMMSNMNGMAPTASDVVDKVMEFIPAIQVIGRSFADCAKIFTNFNSIATAAGIGANIVLTYQGIKVLQLIDTRLKDMATSLAAQTTLIAQKDFPQYVHDMIRERVTQTSLDGNSDHWFFVYHPDNDWYPGFYHILQKEPIGPEFCGYTKQIDTAFVFMLAARRYIEKKECKAKKEGRPVRPTKLHLLIPAYQPILILEALRIPEQIGDFVIEGRINSNREFVWLNLPKEQGHYVEDIGQYLPPTPGWLDWAMSKIGLAETPPGLGERRILGTKQGSTDSDEIIGLIDDNDEDQDETPHDQNEHLATPLEQRHRRRRGTRHRDGHSDHRQRRRRSD